MSTNPFSRSRAKRSRHFRTHRGVRPTVRAMARLPRPRAAKSTARARTAIQAPVRPARQRCRSTRCSLGANRIGVSASGHSHVACRRRRCVPIPPRICHPGWVPNFWDSALATRGKKKSPGGSECSRPALPVNLSRSFSGGLASQTRPPDLDRSLASLCRQPRTHPGHPHAMSEPNSCQAPIFKPTAGWRRGRRRRRR